MRTVRKSVWLAGLAVIGLIIAGLLASEVGGMAGKRAGERSKERLQLVFPLLMDMSVSDRALIVGLAMTCHVEDRPAIAGDVVECLRGALDDPHAMFPKGVDHDGARARLDQLLQQRNM